MKTNLLRISLIEDDDDDHFLFSMALDAIGIPNTLTIVKDGINVAANVKYLESLTPDIIFLNWHSKHIDGLAYLEQIKSNDFLREIPCIILSAYAYEADVTKAFEAGANLYIIKAREFARFTDLLKKALSLDWKEYFPPEYELFLLS